ncbi:hypothetical protein J4573_08055 [Actinomadura barringtoniae]|uniref:Phospholipid carrier-dependent glycosyltransferase n=1 Tax=Actinomadura barringtoniae TaxID=1427535 RepID=A0A939T3Q0_9ACTN|nr:hypothetical protein [Actinomadura barringtoniae]MBO2447039.1 hypothetical protein [Actinomadura barringtoniae]
MVSLSSAAGRLGALVRAHRPFAIVLAVGAVVRVVAMLGYTPALWFNDSYDYVRIGLDPFAHPIRPVGYGIWLWVLKPFHSFALVAGLQHLMGLAIGVMIYALLRRRGLPGWGAVLAAVPVLLDGNQIQLEQVILSDTLFEFLVITAVVLVLWRTPSVWMCAAAGLLLAAATLTRTIGLPVLLIALGVLAFQRVGWRRPAALAVAGLLPLPLYAGWFHAENGTYAISVTDGIFLWGRTAAFADCEKIKPSPDLAGLCPVGEPGHRRSSSTQIWNTDDPNPLGWAPGQVFTAEQNDRAQRFALEAIKTQPLDYVQAVSYDLFVRTFSPVRAKYPTPYVVDGYTFLKHPQHQPKWNVYKGGTPTETIQAYEHGSARTRTHEPFATMVRGYQQVVALPGTALAVVLLVPFGVWARQRRRPDSAVALPWLTSTALLVVPPVTTDFDYRYVVVAVPFACLAAGLACVRGRGRPALDDDAERTAREPAPAS